MTDGADAILWQGTVIQNSRSHNVGKDGRKYHTWPFSERDIGFEDIIVVSDECNPDPQLEGISYTLWTTDHEKDDLHIDGERSNCIAPCKYLYNLTGTHSSSSADPFLLGSQHVTESGCKGKPSWAIL
jgi:hypothetical protein